MPTSESLLEYPAARRIGVISDTHGLLRPEALELLRGVDMILHAGDVGKPFILDALGEIAPVLAVRGNVDAGPWADALPETLTVSVAGRSIHMIHNVKAMAAGAPAGAEMVVFGHSHVPTMETLDGVLYLNPGSAGPKRFSLPITLALLDLVEGTLVPRIVEIREC